MSKKSIECYDNVNHKEMLESIFLMNTRFLWADDVRWLKAFGYIPQHCICCEGEIEQFNAICFDCYSNFDKNEVEEVKKYIEKNKKEV